MFGIAIPINCANCGAPLTITPDMESFHCGFCGSQLVVERKGGTVALKKIESAIQQVQIGTDRTAAELAVTRLSRELTQLMQAKKAMAEPLPVTPTVSRRPDGLVLMVLSLASLLVAGFVFVLIDASTYWARHGLLLRTALWFTAAIAAAFFVHQFLRACRVRKKVNDEYNLRLQQDRMASQAVQAEREREIGRLREQIEKVRQQLAENRKVLDKSVPSPPGAGAMI